MALRPKDTRPHVIVVEDEQFQRETLTDFLDENGYRASGVESGAALRKLVEKDPPALVLLDLRLPGGDDGFSLARFLRERSRKMGIIMLTASGDTVDQVVGLETGADDYIAKPYEPRALLARMKAVLRRAGGAHAATPGERVRVGKCLLDLEARRMTALTGEEVPLRAATGCWRRPAIARWKPSIAPSTSASCACGERSSPTPRTPHLSAPCEARAICSCRPRTDPNPLRTRELTLSHDV